MSQPDTTQLRQFILAHYDLDELKTLCADLAVIFDDLGGEGRAGKTRELALYMERHGRLIDLRAVLTQQRETAYQAAFGETAAQSVVTATLPRRERRRFERNPRQVFVSHATADATFAHRLADDLRRAGFTIWIAPESIPAGQWVSAINRGLAESGVMLLVLTPAALESPWVEMETNVAIELERGGELRFIPICLLKGRYDPVWHAYQWVMFDGDYGVGLDALLRRLDGFIASNETRLGKMTISDQRTLSETHALNSDQADNEIEKRLAAIENDLHDFHRYVTSNQASELSQTVKSIALVMGNHSGRNEYGSVYGELYRKFGITSYRELPARRFDEAMRFLNNWLEQENKKSKLPQNLRIHEMTGIELVRVPAGPFLYGSSDADKMAPDNEKPQRTIDLPEFWIGRYPVTNAQYKRFLDANPNYPVPLFDIGLVKLYNWDKPRRTYPAGKGDHPVVLVSWDDAQAFCDWAGLALPSEEQWEKAARGTDGRVWPWGNDEPTADHCNFNMNINTTTPVGKYSPKGDSPYGCADMAGNVWEWTDSWYDETKARRVVRGGSWINLLNLARAASRLNFHPVNRDLNVGFRVVRRPPSQAL